MTANKVTKKLNLKQKLAAIRQDIGVMQKTVPTNIKGVNSVDPAELLLKLNEAMDTHGVLLTPEIKESQIKELPMPTAKNANNVGYLCEAKLLYTWNDLDSNETVECEWFATGNHLTDPAMAYGGALTYSERYFLLKYFQIPTVKDDPEFLQHKHKHAAGRVEYINESQAVDLLAKLEEKKIAVPQVFRRYNISDLTQLQTWQFNESMRDLETMI